MGKIWIGVQNSSFFTDNEKRTVYALISKYNINSPINESILSKMREGISELSKDENFDEKALDKLMDIMSNSGTFSAYLADLLGKSWDKILAYYKSSFDGPKTDLMNLINTGQYDFPRATLDREMEDMRKLSVFWLKDLRKGLVDDIKQKYAKCLLAESLENSADVITVLKTFNPNNINEGKWSFLNRSAEVISGTEPFKTIRQVSGLNRKFNNTSINKFSELSRNIGGPNCGKFTCLGTVAAKLCDMRGDFPSAEKLLSANPMLRFLPDYKSMIESFELMALISTVMELMSDLKKSK